MLHSPHHDGKCLIICVIYLFLFFQYSRKYHIYEFYILLSQLISLNKRCSVLLYFYKWSDRTHTRTALSDLAKREKAACKEGQLHPSLKPGMSEAGAWFNRVDYRKQLEDTPIMRGKRSQAKKLGLTIARTGLLLHNSDHARESEEWPSTEDAGDEQWLPPLLSSFSNLGVTKTAYNK